MEEEDGKLVIGSLVRSSVESQKSIVKSQIEAVADVLGGKSISSSDYPGWEFKKESRFVILRLKNMKRYLERRQ